MASHGGILGLVVFTWFYSRKKQVSWTGLGDGLCVVAPLGIMFGRLANFINGELYGRTAEGLAWAMKFPMTLMDGKMAESEDFGAAIGAAAEVDESLRPAHAQWMNGGLPDHVMFETMLVAQRANPDVSAAIAPFLFERHPSQLYQALGEGGLLFAILWFVRVRHPRAPYGLLTGLFFIFYAVFRIIGEHFREPDAAMVGALTSGQFLSTFMIAIGAAFVIHAWRRGPVSEGS